MGVTEIGAEGEDVARYSGVIAWTMFERPHGEAMSQVVDARSRLAWLAPQTDLARDLAEQRTDGVIARRSSGVGYEQSSGVRDDRQACREIPINSGASSWDGAE